MAHKKDRIPPQSLGTSQVMKFLFGQLAHRLTVLFVAVAFAFAALGMNASVTQANQSTTLCNGVVSENVQVDQELGHPRLLKVTDASMNGDSIFDQSQNDSGKMKSPCCSSFCTPAFFAFSDSILNEVAIEKNSKWPLSMDVLNPADSDSLKRPPRNSFLQV